MFLLNITVLFLPFFFAYNSATSHARIISSTFCPSSGYPHTPKEIVILGKGELSKEL